MGKSRKWLIGGAAGLAVCLGGYVFGVPYIEVVQAANGLDAEVKRAKSLDNPLTADELITSPVKQSENAASDLKLILAEPRVDQLATEGRDALDAIARKDFKEAELVLLPWQPALALATKAAQKPKLNFDRDWNTTIDLQFPEYEPLKGVVRGLCAEAELEYRLSKWDEGDAHLKSAFSVARLVGQEPTLLSALVEVSCRFTAKRTIESLAQKNRDKEAVLARLSEVMVERPMPDFKNNLRAEMFCWTAVVRNLDKYGGFNQLERTLGASDAEPDSPLRNPPDPSELRKEGLPSSLTDKAFLARHLNLWNDVLEAVKETEDPIEISKVLQSRTKKLESETGSSYAYVKLTAPMLSPTAPLITNCRAGESATRGLIEVLRFKQKKGRYPADLAEVGFAEIDPYSGQPFKLFIKGDAVRVYSVGPNKKDENGLGVEGAGDTVSPELDDISARTDRPVRVRPAKPRSTGKQPLRITPTDPLPNSRTASPPLAPPR